MHFPFSPLEKFSFTSLVSMMSSSVVLFLSRARVILEFFRIYSNDFSRRNPRTHLASEGRNSPGLLVFFPKALHVGPDHSVFLCLSWAPNCFLSAFPREPFLGSFSKCFFLHVFSALPPSVRPVRLFKTPTFLSQSNHSISFTPALVFLLDIAYVEVLVVPQPLLLRLH